MPTYDLNHIRSLFPFLRNGTVYLDHASVGPVPLPTRKAVESYLVQRSEGSINILNDFLRIHTQTKERVGRLLHAPKDRIAFCENTSNGLNILASGLEWKTGDRVILADIEFPANVHPFLNQKRHGVEIDFVKSRNNEIHVEDIERLITVRTRVVSISHVQFLHGSRSDMAALGELCSRKDLIFCVDAIQAAGVVPIDVAAMKIGFLSCGSQKWLLTTEGIGFVYVSEETQSRIQQAYLGWLSMKDFFSDFFRYRLDLDATARRYEGGTLNVAGIVALNASLDLLLGIGIPNIQQHLTELTQVCIDRIIGGKVELLTPADPHKRAGIVSFRPPDAQALFEKLKAGNIVVSLREQSIRFSPHFYNTKDEVEKALDVAFG